ncbi:MAG: LPS export ABC transporter permease LptG [Deltaproteobacteria bacterium RBG_16_50_11]|nr:MAG: LPS export ABC transporter permease LptG [Deltaproteobacteria bacterium RBG_16_50_11]
MFENHGIINRYVIREYLKIFSLCLGALIFIYAVVLFFGKMDVITKHQAPFYLIFEYLLYKIPEVTFQWTLPYGVLLSTLLTLGNFSRHSEITAMKAGGVSLYRITLPLISLALIFSFFSFLGNEYLVPVTNQKMRHLLSVQVRKEQPSSSFKNYKIWFHGDHRIFNIQLLDPETRVLKGLTLYEFNDQFRCVRRIDAREAKWIEGRWRLYDGAIREFGEKGSIQVNLFKEGDFTLPENWETFQNMARKSEEMSYTELRNYVQKIQSAGYDATRYQVDLYSKLSYPLLNLIMVLIGVPFALRTGRSGGVALSIGISVMIGFTYGILFYVFLFFGKSGLLPPFLSCWIPTALFGLAGIFTLMSIRQ